MKILENYDLTKLNTFGISVKARYFIEVTNEQDLTELFSTREFKENEKLFLGGGSNILITRDFPGIVVLNRLKGIEIVEKNSDYILVKSMGGEWWNDLVNFAVERKYWGIENLSLIPGTVGAAPMQNIGAYGVELKDTLENVEAYNILTGEKRVFSKEECELGYRDSVFKRELKGKYFVLAITLKLNKKSSPNVSYKFLKDFLEENKLEITNIKNISNAISEIRKSKLPDPKVLGNAGSFFKNVFVDEDKFKELKKEFLDIPFFNEDNCIKIPAGWLIEQCGWKGKRVGNVGVHDKQALVIVNYNGATGEEIKNLADQIIDSVYQKFGLKLIPEINFI
jgi:UDP-N-acetylmuramate dehydrogenase